MLPMQGLTHPVMLLLLLTCMQYYTKLEARDAADAVSRAPEAAVSALGTAGEILAGAAGHVVDKVGPSQNIVLIIFTEHSTDHVLPCCWDSSSATARSSCSI